MHEKKMKVIFDMETQDPDDFLTLLFLLGHPQIDLRAVTVTPGSTAQVGIVRYALKHFNRHIPVGAYNLYHPKPCVSRWHYKAYGNIPSSHDADEGYQVLAKYSDEETTLITGAPLKNVGKAARQTSFIAKQLVAQGGFAGQGVVPEHLQMDKFKGKHTCPTFNLGGDPQSAHDVLNYQGIPQKYFVSKNVCHSVVYDVELHKQVTALRKRSKSLQMIWRGMDMYLGGGKKVGKSKKLHDPLAACCAICPEIGTWAKVELYSQGREWGSRLVEEGNTYIIVDYNRELFLQTFLAV